MIKKINRVFRIIWFLLAIGLLFSIIAYQGEIPYSEAGTSFVVDDAERFARTLSVHDADATNDYIFLNHGQNGLISAFDWSGAYCFTIVTTAAGNGLAEIYCCENEITIIDKSKHVFVYDGSALTQEYQLDPQEQYSNFRAKLIEKKNNYVMLVGKEVVDADGNLILKTRVRFFCIEHSGTGDGSVSQSDG